MLYFYYDDLRLSTQHQHSKRKLPFPFSAKDMKLSSMIIILLAMKKFSIVPSEAIRKHLANTGKSKVTHAFPKAMRFSPPNPEYVIANLGANKHSTAARLHSPSERVVLVLEKDLISLETPLFHQDRRLTSIVASLRSLV
jgi:hypothetical protein